VVARAPAGTPAAGPAAQAGRGAALPPAWAVLGLGGPVASGVIARTGGNPSPIGPSPPPTGVPGGPAPSAGSGGSGLTLVFILVGLLVLAAPPAARRVRPARVPWRLAPVVAIPERPG
jgi:hypothetical protein